MGFEPLMTLGNEYDEWIVVFVAKAMHISLMYSGSTSTYSVT